MVGLVDIKESRNLILVCSSRDVKAFRLQTFNPEPELELHSFEPELKQKGLRSNLKKKSKIQCFVLFSLKKWCFNVLTYMF